jgi:hypothetical protein
MNDVPLGKSGRGSPRLVLGHIDIGQGNVTWVVMADPDDNEFCVLSPQ